MWRFWESGLVKMDEHRCPSTFTRTTWRNDFGLFLSDCRCLVISPVLVHIVSVLSSMQQSAQRYSDFFPPPRRCFSGRSTRIHLLLSTGNLNVRRLISRACSFWLLLSVWGEEVQPTLRVIRARKKSRQWRWRIAMPVTLQVLVNHWLSSWKTVYDGQPLTLPALSFLPGLVVCRLGAREKFTPDDDSDLSELGSISQDSERRDQSISGSDVVQIKSESWWQRFGDAHIHI